MPHRFAITFLSCAAALRVVPTSVRMSASPPSVVVLGGSGFVGSRVCRDLVGQGAKVTSVSKSGAAPSAFAGEAWTSEVDWRACDLLRGPREGISAAIGTPDAVVSCVGAVGFDRQGLLLGNGVANVEAAGAVAKSGGAERYVFVSVASEVADLRQLLPDFFLGYFDGKLSAEAAIAKAVRQDGETTVVKPSFIYGGDSFGLFPPRVTAGYGSAVEELLSASPIQALADRLSWGPLGLVKVALRPPVSVDAVAGACALAAMGSDVPAVMDGTAQINEAAGAPTATGLSDAISAVKSRFEKLTAGAAA
jgi:nucleoside-diphosphate-sugar epimerase